jgi:hypothetical protein
MQRRSDEGPATLATLFIADPRFPLGRPVMTKGALDSLDGADVCQAIARHAQGDWGEICKEDAEANERALADGGRLFSVYRDRRETRFYVITEADRSATTVLLPEEY